MPADMAGGVEQLHVHPGGGCSQQTQHWVSVSILVGIRLRMAIFEGPSPGSGPLVGHNEDILRFQDLDGGQVRLDADGHSLTAFQKRGKSGRTFEKSTCFSL